MSYPVAYRRKATAPGRGSQTSPARSVPRQSPLKPANDNWPAPANDNAPRRTPAGRAAAGFGRRAAPYVGGALRVAKVHPAIGRFLQVAEVAAGYYDKRVAEAMQYGGMRINTTGYIRDMVCNGGGFGTHISNVNGWGVSCGAAAPFVAADADMTCPPAPSEFWTWEYSNPYITAGFSQYWRKEHWRWNQVTNPVPGVRPTRNVNLGPLPLMPPMADPMSLPMDRPLGAPVPVPYRWLPYRRSNPYRSPTEQTQFGYKMAVPYWFPLIGPFPSQLQWPGQSAKPVPGQPVVPGVKPNPQPPGPRNHERKSKAKGAMAMALRAGYAVTEGLDALDAVFKALPAKYRKGAETPQEKAYRIWKHYKHLDMGKVVFNLVANHYTDKLVGGASGRAGRDIKKATGHHSLPSVWA